MESVSKDIGYLYRYRSLKGEAAQRVERTFLHAELYFPRPNQFNDPFDCSPAIATECTRDEYVRYLETFGGRNESRFSKEGRALLRAARESPETLPPPSKSNLIETVKDVVNSAGVLSLSSKRDDILMWSHYADSHAGVCLRVRASQTTPFFGRALPVKYQMARPILNVFRDSLSQQVEKALCTKSIEWSYESEWRIIEYKGGPGVHEFPPDLLDGVILGSKISDEDRRHVENWISRRSEPTEVLKAEIDPVAFRVCIRPV